MSDGPTYGTAADTHPLGEVYTVHSPEPASEPYPGPLDPKDPNA